MASGVSALNDDAAVRPNPGPGHATGEQSRPAFNASTDGRTDKSVNGRVRASRGPGAYPRGRWRRNSKQIRRPRPRGHAPEPGLRGLELATREIRGNCIKPQFLLKDFGQSNMERATQARVHNAARSGVNYARLMIITVSTEALTGKETLGGTLRITCGLSNAKRAVNMPLLQEMNVIKEMNNHKASLDKRLQQCTKLYCAITIKGFSLDA
mgnify:CR=1 FL=1